MEKRTRTCSFEGCEREQLAKGWCSAHYQQRRSGKELKPVRVHQSLEQRFWSKVNKDATGGCWSWEASTSTDGYGQIRVNGRAKTVHRLSWEWANGAIPDGMFIDHRCHNRRCVNPEHLRLVTNAQNMQHQAHAPSNNTSGARGVSWAKDRQAWRAYARLNNRLYFGGYHSTVEAADRAARALRAQLFTHDDHDQWVQAQTAPPKNDEAA